MERVSLFETVTQDPVELNSLILKSKLAAIIRIMVSNAELSQKQVAKMLETTQPRISNLLGGQLAKFSVDFLLESLCRLGYKFDIDFDPRDMDEPMQIAVKKAVL
ncbi:MAG: XRE family transcriptional regulator [Proteobacteria bacterium]|nr:MAG: XRE family transcriptional regulator [Pseudomonadota bacterium]